MAAIAMDHLDQLENRSVHILREAYANFKNLGMLWSIGKDSTVLLCLARKAFFGHVPIPLVHIDTAYKIPEMIEYRDRLALEWNLTMIVGQNRESLADKRTFPAIDITRSGTRKEELLTDPAILKKMYVLRRILNPMGTMDAIDFLLDKLRNTKNNAEFFESMNT